MKMRASPTLALLVGGGVVVGVIAVVASSYSPWLVARVDYPVLALKNRDVKVIVEKIINPFVRVSRQGEVVNLQVELFVMDPTHLISKEKEVRKRLEGDYKYGAGTFYLWCIALARKVTRNNDLGVDEVDLLLPPSYYDSEPVGDLLIFWKSTVEGTPECAFSLPEGTSFDPEDYERPDFSDFARAYSVLINLPKVAELFKPEQSIESQEAPRVPERELEE